MRHILRFVGFIVLVAGIASIGVCASSNGQDQKKSSNDRQSPQESKQTPPVPPYHRSAKDAQPFPELLPPSQFAKYPVVARAYEIAHLIPGVLAQQPCYCGCDRHFGHASLLDCYASDHTAGCMVCLKESFFTFQMTRQGKKPAEIREAIIRGDWRNTNLDQPKP
jgi:hypothetical protein